MWQNLWKNDTARLIFILALLLLLLSFLFIRLFSLQSENHRRELASNTFQEQALLTSGRAELARRKEAIRQKAVLAMKTGQSEPSLIAWIEKSSQKIHHQGKAPEFAYRVQANSPETAKRWIGKLDDDRRFPSGRSHRLTATIELAKFGPPLTQKQIEVWQKNMIELWETASTQKVPGHLKLIRNLPAELQNNFQTHLRLLEKVKGIDSPGLWVEANGRLGLAKFSNEDWQAMRDQLASMGVSLQPASYSPSPVLEAQVTQFDIQAKQGRERFMLYAIAGLLAITFLILGFSIQALLVSQRRKQMMVHTVSHEFRTPLASMLQFTEMLLDKRYANPQKAESYLQMLYHQGLRLKGLIENVMTIAKIEKKLLRLNTAPVPIHDFLEEIAEFYRHIDHDFARDLQLHIHHEPLTAIFDREALTRILTNLIDNARKYGEPPLEIHARVEAKTWELTVRDHGPGLPKDMAHSVFKPYARGPLTTREGLGLGLSVVYALVKAMAGQIETKTDQGFHFTMRFPIKSVEGSDDNNHLSH